MAVGNVCRGERVYAYTRRPVIHWGTYAEYVPVRAEHVAPMLASTSFAEAACIPLPGLTAWQALFEFADLAADQSVLVHAGAGGLGSMAIQLARRARARVYTTATRRNHDYVRRLGAHHAIDDGAERFVDAIRRAKPQGVDVVLDTVGGAVLSEGSRS